MAVSNTGDPKKKGTVKTTGTSTTKSKNIRATPNSPNAKLSKEIGAVPDNWRHSDRRTPETIRERHEAKVLKDRGSVKSGKTGRWTVY